MEDKVQKDKVEDGEDSKYAVKKENNKDINNYFNFDAVKERTIND